MHRPPWPRSVMNPTVARPPQILSGNFYRYHDGVVPLKGRRSVTLKHKAHGWCEGHSAGTWLVPQRR